MISDLPMGLIAYLQAEQGMYRDTETVFREDFRYDRSPPRCSQHPDNVWALQGLVECVQQGGDVNERRLLRLRLAFAKARADIAIESACHCQTVPDTGEVVL